MQAIVVHRGNQRKAKGFSSKEMVEADMSCEKFCSLNLRWDSRRQTSYKENVDALKSVLKTKK
ncbi:hypothetical protein J4219_07195 [Candidatus Woesearchaeota archaeon]|nr:hypothetical protein [Candidatus Woesearchaeota archaeon]